ncbi:MAG: Ca2+-binding RTX toxin-like protein [Dinoroseobacter sp.]|jgi:Ca2+-binding RTX toxin-like protein
MLGVTFLLSFLSAGLGVSFLLPDADDDSDAYNEEGPDAPEPDILGDLSLLNEIDADGTANGTGRGDFIRGGDNADTINARGADDVVFGGEGDDTIFGGGQADVLRGNKGDDVLDGNGGDDYLRGDRGADRLFGRFGDDYLGGGSGPDVLFGGEGDDVLIGRSGQDTLQGEEGNDRLYGNNGKDFIGGGQGYDVLYGGDQKDDLNGGRGNDEMFGGTWADRMHGGRGDDVMFGGNGQDLMIGAKGDDFLSGGLGEDVLRPGTGENIVDAINLEYVDLGGEQVLRDTDAGDEIELEEGGENTVYVGENDVVIIEGGENQIASGDYVRTDARDDLPRVEGFNLENDSLGYYFSDNVDAVPSSFIGYDEDENESLLVINGTPVMVLEGGDFSEAEVALFSYDASAWRAEFLATQAGDDDVVGIPPTPAQTAGAIA